MKIFSKSIYKLCKKSFGFGNLHSKYIIIGAGFTGLSIAKKLTSVK
jgi:hypothetical protein